MSEFHQRLDRAIQISGLSYRELSIRIGVGEAYITNLLRKQSDPGFGTTQKICQVLGISLNELAGMGEKVEIASTRFEEADIDRIAQGVYSRLATETWINTFPQGQRPSIDDVLNWWINQNGVLHNFDQISEYVDLFTPPTETSQMITPHKLGATSLVSMAFGIDNNEKLHKILETLDESQNERILISHRETSLGRPVLSVETLDVGIAEKGRVKVQYKRILLPVRDLSGRSFILNYAQPLPRFI